MTYTPRLKARAHQAEALQRMRQKPDAFALLMEMGTGKTKVVLDEWGERVEAGDLTNLLVIAPAGAYANWFLDRSPEEPSEATKHLDPALRERMLIGHWKSGGNAAWRHSFDRVMKEKQRPRMLVVNVEAMSFVPTARAACKDFIASGRTLVCVDESTRIKTPGTKRTNHVIRLGAKAASRRIMTGLATPKSPMDLYSQFEFLDEDILGFKTFASFRAEFAIQHQELFEGARWPTWVIDGYKNLDKLHELIAPYSYRKTKAECLDLPPKVYQSVDVPLTAEQERMYEDLLEYATATLDGEKFVTATMIITQIQRLHQILCGYTVSEDKQIIPVPERRTDILIDVLEEHDDKAVIWVGYDYNVRYLADRLKRHFEDPRIVATFWGGNTATRLNEETRFKTDPACRFMIATPGSGGVGNNWMVANLEVYYSNDYDLEHRIQSEDRLHRDGQRNNVTIVDLIARDTVDEKIIKALRDKIDLATVVNGDNYREWLI